MSSSKIENNSNICERKIVFCFKNDFGMMRDGFSGGSIKMSGLYRLVISFFCRIIRVLLGLRYRLRVKGLSKITALKKHKPGVLFLPNHPAEIDPILLMCLLGPKFFPRSVVVEHFYHLKGFKWILDLVRVIPVPSMDEKANQWRGKELSTVFESILEQIQEGENFIIYPSGKLKRSGLERLGGASFVHSLLEKSPDVPVVLIRTTGLWGSSFSVAQTGESPDFGSIFRKGIKTLFKNLLFFTPRRDVLIEFEEVTFSIPKEESRLVFNRYLEQWYNRYPFPGEEPPSLVPYSIWKEEEIPLKIVDVNLEEAEDIVHLSAKEEAEIYGYLAKLSGMEASSIGPKSDLSFDLGLDSLDVAQVYLFIDKKYDIADVAPGSLSKVQDVFKVVAQKEEFCAGKEPKKIAPILNFIEKKQRKEPCFLEAKTIPELFLVCCDRMGSSIACADRRSGSFSYKALKTAALVMSLKVRDFPGEYVGILLPSSVASYLAILSVLLAGKVPVMLNWTAGKTALSHALKVSNFKVVLTAKSFLDNIQLEDLSEIEHLFVFLEEVKKSIRLKDKLKGFCLSKKSASRLVEQLPVNKNPESMAVLLFTSGTESLPKAVPLSHVHILTNQKNAFACTDLKAQDVFYGVLPPFHSFGFSLTGLLPLLCGIKVFYGPDPTDGRSMALDIEEAGVTVFCAAPTFVRSLFAGSDPKQLKTLRLVVVGAERMPQDLQAFIKEHLKKATLLEGYGITECSPVVTLQRIEEERLGVGRPILETEILIVDPISLVPVSLGLEGEICISGPSVFNGYLNAEKEDSFFERSGKRWYRSGDLGRLDKQGNVHLTDRLKRMMKIGAEMVSLGGVEEELLHAAKERVWYTSLQEGFPLAVVAREIESQKSDLVVFTVFKVGREEVNQALRESGFGRIVKISEVIQISEIPLTGTGKIHHRILEERLKKK